MRRSATRPSVLVGDFLYSRAFQLMVSVDSHARAARSVADATNVIAEGEVLQLMNTGNPGLDEVAYLDVIQRKTAKLFEAAAQLGAVLGGADPEREAGASPATACISAPRSSSWTTCSTTRASRGASARTSATISPRAR